MRMTPLVLLAGVGPLILASWLAPAEAVAAATVEEVVCDLVGTEGDDVLLGTDADEVICGLGGDDHIFGGGGNDTLYGGAGNDVLRGGTGHDVVLGGPGDDVLSGNGGKDRLRGQRGADRLDGGSGRDLLIGGAGDDECTDRRGRTRSRGCVGGLIGLREAQRRWERVAPDEYVYVSRTLKNCAPDEACPAVYFGSVAVRVGPGNDPGSPTIEQLHAEARAALLAGGEARFDAATGVPRWYQRPDVWNGGRVIHHFEPRDELRAGFETAVERWSEQKPAAYSYVVRTICFCPGLVDLRVVVRDGVVESTEPLGSVESVPAGEVWQPDAITLDAHLERVRELLDGTTAQLTARFDDQFGYPVSYGYDISFEIADEEATVEIREFTVLD